MATYRVWSGAGGGADGSTWADAYVTLKAAVEARLAGDIFLVDSGHAETQAADTIITFAGTAASPQIVVCVDSSSQTNENPTTTATTATVSTTTGGDAIFLVAGFVYIYGVKFQSGTDNPASSSANISIGVSNLPVGFVLEDCGINVGANNGVAHILFGSDTQGADDIFIKLINPTITFFNAGCAMLLEGGDVEIHGGVLTSAQDSAFKESALLAMVEATITGMDFTAQSSDILVTTVDGSSNKYLFTNCELGASTTIQSGSLGGPGGAQIDVRNCDSGDTNYVMERHRYEGTVKADAVITVTSGPASDGVTPISWKMVSSAGSHFQTPLYTPWMTGWIADADKGSKTWTVPSSPT